MLTPEIKITLLGRLIFEVTVEVVLSVVKAEKAHPHAALLDEVKKVLRHFLGPHDPGDQFHLVIGNLELNGDLGVGRADVGGFYKHSGGRDVLGKGHSACLVDTKAYC